MRMLNHSIAPLARRRIIHYLDSLSSATCTYKKSEGFYSTNEAIYAHVASFVKCVILFDNAILKEEWANNENKNQKSTTTRLSSNCFSV